MLSIPPGIWATWAAASLLTFAVLEGVALLNGKATADTLSENLRRWLGIEPRRPVRRWAVPVFVAGLLGFVVWFVPHILWSIW